MEAYLLPVPVVKLLCAYSVAGLDGTDSEALCNSSFCQNRVMGLSASQLDIPGLEPFGSYV